MSKEIKRAVNKRILTALANDEDFDYGDIYSDVCEDFITQEMALLGIDESDSWNEFITSFIQCADLTCHNCINKKFNDSTEVEYCIKTKRIISTITGDNNITLCKEFVDASITSELFDDSDSPF
jgi:hypothetical protein